MGHGNALRRPAARAGTGVPARSGCPRCGRRWEAALSRCGWCGALRHPDRCDRHREGLASWACAVCGTRLCSRCRHGTRHVALCGEHRDVAVVQGWAEVARAADEIRGEVLAGGLRAAGFDAQLLSQKDHAAVVAFGGLAVVRILVPAFQYQAARETLVAESGHGEGPTG